MSDEIDGMFECDYDGTCYRPKGSCKDCTNASPKPENQVRNDNE